MYLSVSKLDSTSQKMINNKKNNKKIYVYMTYSIQYRVKKIGAIEVDGKHCTTIDKSQKTFVNLFKK